VLLCTLRTTLSDRLSLMLIIPSSAQNQTKSPLLRVPGDIRNMIMEYALSETDGLRYRFPEEGSHRFYPRPICTPVKCNLAPLSKPTSSSTHVTSFATKPQVCPSDSTISPSCVPRSTSRTRLAKSRHSALVSASAACSFYMSSTSTPTQRLRGKFGQGKYLAARVGGDFTSAFELQSTARPLTCADSPTCIRTSNSTSTSL
jgi:hypothetical protein